MTSDDVATRKRQLRVQVRARLAALPPERLERAAQAVLPHALGLVDVALEGRAGPVALFASMSAEIPTAALDEALRGRGVERVLPRVSGADLTFHLVPRALAAQALPKSGYGIPEPAETWEQVALESCALVFMPGLAFDERGRRLGYGRGFYDRALARARRAASPPLAAALALDEQLVEAVPVDELDERPDLLCTPALGVVRFR